MSMVLRARIVELKSDAKHARERARKLHERASKFGRQKGNRGGRNAQLKMSSMVQAAYNADNHYKAIEEAVRTAEWQLAQLTEAVESENWAAARRAKANAIMQPVPPQPASAPLRHSPELVRAVQRDGRQMAVAALAMAYKMTKAEIIHILNMEV